MTRLVLLLVVACAPKAEPRPDLDAPTRPLLPTALRVRDGRPGGPETLELRDALQWRAEYELRNLGVPKPYEDAPLLAEIDLVALSTVYENGPHSCVRFVGRVIRGGQAFASVDVAAERCALDERYAGFHDPAVLAELKDPKAAPSAQGQLMVQALDALVAQLARQCR